MIVQELASELNKLFREGKGSYPVYFKQGELSFPIMQVKESSFPIGNEKHEIIVLVWKE